MGMSIDKIIKSFNYIKHVGNGKSAYEHCREEIALNEAITIMHKYQKIEEIIDNWTKTEALEWEIRKVLEDGNDKSRSN